MAAIALRVSGGAKTYVSEGHRSPVFSDVDLQVPEGQILVLLGPSGCGKSTLGHSLLNLEGQARGEVRFAGRDLLALDARALRKVRRELQVIFQDPFSSLNPRLPVREIVGEGLRIHEPALSAAQTELRIAEALEEVGLSRAVMERYAHEFSGGQRQRLAIARALVLRPRFIVLDEATSDLDSKSQASIQQAIREMHGQRTVIIVAHRLSTVRDADMIVTLDAGRVVESGTHDELVQLGGIYAEFHAMESRRA